MKYVVEVFRVANPEDGSAKYWLYGNADGEPLEHDAAEGLALRMRTERNDLTTIVLPLRNAP